MKKLKILVVGLLFSSLTAYALNTGEPNPYYAAASSIKMAVTGMYLGSYSGGTCGNWQTVFENANAVPQDFTQSLDLGSGQAPLGSYDCIALKVVNYFNVTVNGNALGQCAGWTGQAISTTDPLYDLVHTRIDPVATTGNLYLYFRVGGAGGVFDTTDGASLNQAVNITSSTTSLSFKFVDGSDYNPAVNSGNGITDLGDNGGVGSCTFNDNNVSFSVTQN